MRNPVRGNQRNCRLGLHRATPRSYVVCDLHAREAPAAAVVVERDHSRHKPSMMVLCANCMAFDQGTERPIPLADDRRRGRSVNQFNTAQLASRIHDWSWRTLGIVRFI